MDEPFSLRDKFYLWWLTGVMFAVGVSVLTAILLTLKPFIAQAGPWFESLRLCLGN